MCGIAGYFGNFGSRASAKDLLARMIGAVRHRGPDAEGVLVNEGAGLAHARLSIIDLSASGAQPMSNDDGSVSITFNGEIFNYIELRDELIARGRKFRSTSDTEVIIRLYEEMGPDCVERLNGDFAFAIWDARRRQLMLARDRMGVRPLFYARAQRRALLRLRGEVAAAGSRYRGGARSDRARPDLSPSGSRSPRARSSRACRSCRRRTCSSHAATRFPSAATGASTFPTPMQAMRKPTSAARRRSSMRFAHF